MPDAKSPLSNHLYFEICVYMKRLALFDWEVVGFVAAFCVKVLSQSDNPCDVVLVNHPPEVHNCFAKNPSRRDYKSVSVLLISRLDIAGVYVVHGVNYTLGNLLWSALWLQDDVFFVLIWIFFDENCRFLKRHNAGE